MRRIQVSSAAALILLAGMAAASAQSGNDSQGKDDSGRPPASPTGAATAADHKGATADEHLALSKQQQGRIESAIRQANVKPIADPDIPLAAGTTVPGSVQLAPVPDAVVAVLPQFRNYSFFVDGAHELVFVDPALKKIKARVPIAGEASTPAKPRTEEAKTEGSSHDTDAGKRERASARADAQSQAQVGTHAEASSDTGSGSSSATTSRSAGHSKARATRNSEASGQASDDAPNRSNAQSDRMRRTVQNGFYRGRAPRTEPDVTVGSAGPDVIEVPGPPPVIRRVGPPVRPIRPVEGGPPPEPAGPPDRGPLGFFGLFDAFR